MEPGNNKADNHREFIYQIDAEDHVVFANEDWFAFAHENGLASLDQSALIGRSLWDFVADTETKFLFTLVLKRVRATGLMVKLPFRCDSPDCRRFMELAIHLMRQSKVEFRGRILRIERRERVRLLEPDIERSQEFLTVCGWCKKVALPEGNWAEVEDAIKTLRLFDLPILPQITHGMCPPCCATLGEALDKQIPEVRSS